MEYPVLVLVQQIVTSWEMWGMYIGTLSWITLWHGAAVSGTQCSTWEAVSALRIQAQNQIKIRWAKLCARNPEMLLESQGR